MGATKLSLAVLILATVAFARTAKVYQAGQISQVKQVPCSETQHETPPLCREYILESDNIVYAIRPRNQKHDIGFSIGDRTQFRLNKDGLVLRSEVANSKEHPFLVISISPASNRSTADVRPVRLNHLQ